MGNSLTKTGDQEGIEPFPEIITCSVFSGKNVLSFSLVKSNGLGQGQVHTQKYEDK